MANEKRLIDANALVEWLKRVGAFFKCTANHKMMTKNIGKIIDHIEAMPTVDAVEVVHGRWMRGVFEGEYTCSRCGMEYCETDPENRPFKYCPECGSKNE